jgi:hypothetical protein
MRRSERIVFPFLLFFYFGRLQSQKCLVLQECKWWCGAVSSVAVRNRRARDARGKGRRRRWPLLHITTHYRQREQITLLLLLCLLYNLLASPDTHQHRWVGPRQYTAFIWREGCSLAQQTISPLREVIFSDRSEPSICGGKCLSRLNDWSKWRAFQFYLIKNCL